MGDLRSVVLEKTEPALRAIPVSMRATLDNPPSREMPRNAPGRTRRRYHPLRWLAAVVGLAIIAGAIQWYLSPPIVIAVRPSHGPAVEAVYATGTVEATVMMPIAARVTARLMELNVDEPAMVKKGQVLARLEDEDLRSSLAQLQANEQFAQQEYARDEKLLKIGGVARAEYERAKSAWEAAKAAVDKASAEAGYTRLVAPADGRIIQRDGEIGQLIPANQAVFWLAQRSALRISAEVDEEDVALVKAGQDVLIRADAFPGKIFHGRVRSITPKGDTVARSYRVRIQFTQDTPLLIGMTAETNILIARRDNALLVPANAIKGDRVVVVRDNQLVTKAVETGVKGPSQVEIRRGIDAGDLIVTNPGLSLKNGEKVRMRLTDAAPAKS